MRCVLVGRAIGRLIPMQYTKYGILHHRAQCNENWVLTRVLKILADFRMITLIYKYPRNSTRAR